MDAKKPILGVTLYSFTNEWLMRLHTLEELVAKVASLGLGPAVEVVGFQSIRTFPDVDDKFASQFRNLLDRHGLLPSCLGGNCDVGRRKDRLMTDDELLTYLERQLASAKKLGFPVLRIQHFIGPRLFEKVAPLAEKAGVHVACELHSPLFTNHPDVVALRECFDRVGSPYIGFIPDFSSTMIHPPEVYWDSLREAGASQELVVAAQATWASNLPIPEKFAALAEAAAHFKAGEEVAGQLNTAITMFGHMPAGDLAGLLPYARHIHGKFYGVDASGAEPSLPYPELMTILLKAGWHGTISAEWEGHAFTPQPIGFEQVQAWRLMCNRLLAI
jgi:hypothetical protein